MQRLQRHLNEIESNKQYAAKLAIRELIANEVEPIKEANRKAESFLSGANRTENQGYVMDLTKYRETFAIPCKVQGEQMEELSHANEPRFAMIEASAKLAEQPA
jgi:hypothetical protein